MKMLSHVEALNLGNVHPQLAEQFDAAIRQIVEAFVDESSSYSTDKRKAEITVKIGFEHKLETRATTVSAAMSVKLPKRKGVAQLVKLPRGGERFLVEVDDAEQTDMFTTDSADPGGVQ